MDDLTPRPEARISRAKAIDHEDPEAAGFTAGWRWEIEGPEGVGPIASYVATETEAEEAAAAALGRRPGDVRFSRAAA